MKEARKPASLHLLQLFLFFIFFHIMPFLLQPANCWVPAVDVEVGVIMEVGTLEGKMLQTTISMVVSDFYAFHSHFKTRLLLLFRDSGGGPFHVISSATDLQKNSSSLKAIILIARTELESEFLAEFGKQSGIPIISFFSPQVVGVTKTEEPQRPIGSLACYLIWDLACAAEKVTGTAAESDHSYGSELLAEVSAGARFVNRELVSSDSLEVANVMIMDREGGRRTFGYYFDDLGKFEGPIAQFSKFGKTVIHRASSSSSHRSIKEEVQSSTFHLGTKHKSLPIERMSQFDTRRRSMKKLHDQGSVSQVPSTYSESAKSVHRRSMVSRHPSANYKVEAGLTFQRLLYDENITRHDNDLSNKTANHSSYNATQRIKSLVTFSDKNT